MAPNCVVIAANHLYAPDGSHLHGRWNEERVGVELGDNVFVGSLCILLPGTRIGNGSVIVAGSLVSRVIPHFEAGLGGKLQEDRRARIIERIPSRRFGATRDIAAAIEFIMRCDYVSGSTISIDGAI